MRSAGNNFSEGRFRDFNSRFDYFRLCLFQTNDEILARNLGLGNLPGLVYYENNIPNIYKGDLRIERDVLDWLEEQMNNDEIEEVTDEILDKLIESNDALIAVFCKTLSQ